MRKSRKEGKQKMINLNHKIYVENERFCFGGYHPHELYLTDLESFCDVRLEKQPIERGYTRDVYRGEVIHYGRKMRGVFTKFHSGNGIVDVLYDCSEEFIKQIEKHQRERRFPIAMRTLVRYIYLISALPMGLCANYLLFHGRIFSFLTMFFYMLAMREIYNWTRNNIH